MVWWWFDCLWQLFECTWDSNITYILDNMGCGLTHVSKFLDMTPRDTAWHRVTPRDTAWHRLWMYINYKRNICECTQILHTFTGCRVTSRDIAWHRVTSRDIAWDNPGSCCMENFSLLLPKGFGFQPCLDLSFHQWPFGWPFVGWWTGTRISAIWTRPIKLKKPKTLTCHFL